MAVEVELGAGVDVDDVVEDVVGDGTAVGVDDGGRGGEGQLASAGLKGVGVGVAEGVAEADGVAVAT